MKGKSKPGELPTPPPCDELTIVVEELKHAPQTATVAVAGFIQEWENAGAMLTVPETFAATLRIGSRLKVTRAEAKPTAPSPYDAGLCCMAAHANAVPPWTCDCPCHALKD